jgi:hypothetical protein
MTLTLELKPAIEAQIAEKAVAQGISVEQYISNVIENLANETQPPRLSPRERAELWREWIDSHAVGGPPLSDYAVSRESIYTRDDEML